jgi:ADP-ribose pyrophosphatase
MSSDRPQPALAQDEIVATRSTVMYRNPWMTVREDETLRRSGATGTFGVVEKPDFALVIPYERGGFHLVEQFRYPVKGRFWEFPQGSWTERPDADALDLARGELAEETGLKATTMTLMGHLFEAYGYCDQGFRVFLATGLMPGSQRLDEEEEGLITRWFTEDEMWELVDNGRMKDAPSLAALSLFARYRAVNGHLLG